MGLEPPQGQSPPLVGGSLSTAQAPVSYRHATAEAAGNGSTPCIFTHSTPQYGRLGSSLFICVVGTGAGEVYVWEGVKHKESCPVTSARTGNSLCQLQAEVTRLDVYGGAKVLENNSPSRLGSQGEGSSSVGFLWSLFRSQFH